MKPLFIPLKREYYEAFANGSKTHEYRLYGKRWNEKTCYYGRDVVLSLGYGKQNRMVGKITAFGKMLNRVTDIYALDETLACIGIELIKEKDNG